MSEAEANGERRRQKVGPFVVLDELAGGGHARVFRARYEPDKRDSKVKLAPGEHAVIKVLRDAGVRDSAVMAAFSREAELLSMIDHPAVVRGITRGVTSGRVWNAIEYVEGEDVATILKVMNEEKLRMRPELVVSLAADVLSGLAAAQALVDPRGRSLGFIHRDVTPKNVVVDLRGQAKVIDFGNALLSLREEPVADQVSGTPGYLAPEQAKGEQLTQGVDVYGVGLLMFELLTGEPAFPTSSSTDKALLEAHANNRRARWPKGLDVPIELKALVDQALGDTPEDRPPDAAALFALVDALQHDADEAKRRLALVARDLCRSNPDKPAPLFV